MRLKVFLLAIASSMGAFSTYAQTGAASGTKYGIGEDSIRCVTNISLFVPYAKANNYADAYEFWKIAYDECPAATKDIYLHGVRILWWKIEQENDPAKRRELIDELMGLYDKRIEYFGDDSRYGKDWIYTNKGQDYFKYMGNDADPRLVYSWMKEALSEYGNNIQAPALSLLMVTSLMVTANDENHKSTYIDDYLNVSAILDAQLASAISANNEKDIEDLSSRKQVIDSGFAHSGAADCETLENIYGPKIAENKDNLQFLKETISLLRRMRCVETETYFTAAEYAHQIEPTAESALGLARQAHKKGEMDTAMEFYEQAAGMEEDPVVKGETYYLIASLLSNQNQYARARQYALKAIEANPNYGQPLILIGTMYAQTAGNIYPNDNVMKKTVYYAAVDKFERARAVDPSVSADANKYINTYRAYFPSTEEIFMHPDLEKGKTITIPGWINESTTIR